jgi:hypothetical protein
MSIDGFESWQQVSKLHFHILMGMYFPFVFLLYKATASVCPTWEFRCDNGYQCVNHSYHCDGLRHCSDGSDEWYCGMYLIFVYCTCAFIQT